MGESCVQSLGSRGMYSFNQQEWILCINFFSVFGITGMQYSFQSIAEDDDDVAKTAIVMWSTIAEVETKIAQWIDDGEV